MLEDPTQRFTSRAEAYAQYRPHYPPEVLDILREECGLTAERVVADIGSGTGLLAVLFLGHGNQVFGVEPNDAMRQAGEAFLRDYPRFASLPGRAEETGLPAASVDFIVAGQAFHWFEPERTRPEFVRILQPDGWLVLVRNRRRPDPGQLGQAVQELMERCGSRLEVTRRRKSDEAVGAFYGPGGCSLRVCDNRQVLDWPGLRGLLLSHSSVPEPGQPGHEELLAGLRRVFEAHQQDGRVTLEYDTTVHFGRLPGASASGAAAEREGEP